MQSLAHLAAGILGLVLPLAAMAQDAVPDEATDYHLLNETRLQLMIDRADRLMIDSLAAELETRNFQVATDAGTKNVLAEFASSLEGAYFTLNEVLDLPLRDTDRKVRAYFFHDYRQLRALFGPNKRGAYLHPGLLAFFHGGADRQELLDVLAHETTHAFLDQFIVDPDVRLPTWLNEGFATYIGYSLVLNGQIQPGRFYTKHREEYADSTLYTTSTALKAARKVLRRIKRGPRIELAALLDMEPEQFYGKDARDRYDYSWAFVHFLRHHWSGGKKKFSSFIAAIGAGADQDKMFVEIYGQTGVSMEPALHAYVRDILVNPPKPPANVLGR